VVLLRSKRNPLVTCFKVTVVLNIHPLLNMELSSTDVTGSLTYLPCPWYGKFSARVAWRKGMEFIHGIPVCYIRELGSLKIKCLTF